jgi:predicted RNA-binding protein with PIN domain
MPYLIDGYNLLHALGIISGRLGPHGLEKARRRLLGLLHGAFTGEDSQVTVVFDAAGAPPGVRAAEDFQGIQVRYTTRREQADDLIERLIRHESTPRQLTVVSDDHRLQQAARRRQCRSLGCLDFLEELDRRRRQRRQRPPEPSEKTAGASAEEVRHWLSEFADLETDSDMKELFRPFDFEVGEE